MVIFEKLLLLFNVLSTLNASCRADQTTALLIRLDTNSSREEMDFIETTHVCIISCRYFNFIIVVFEIKEFEVTYSLDIYWK